MDAKNQHYVPRFLLRNFTQGKKSQIWAYDKHSDKRFKTNIKNIAAERDFYDIEINGQKLSLEGELSILEEKASSSIKKLLAFKNLAKLEEDDRIIIGVFMAIQFLRTKEHRIRIDEFTDSIRQQTERMGHNPKFIDEAFSTPNGLNGGKLTSLKNLTDANGFAEQFLNKNWVLYETPKQSPFFISDNPIALDNEHDYGQYGNLGLSVPGIQIHMPLSSTLVLALLCPSITRQFLEVKQQADKLDALVPGAFDKLTRDPEGARGMWQALTTGAPVQINAMHLERINSLQVLFSTQYVYCQTESFDLVQRMIDDNESHRSALRPTIN